MDLFRLVHPQGETLKVRVLAEFKVLVALNNQEDLVLLQLGRRVRFVGLPPALCPELGVEQESSACYIALPERGDCAFGFTFDDSGHRVLYTADLPEGQVVEVFPEA